MRAGFAAAFVLLVGSPAHADGPGPRRGFQMHYGVGVAVPAGNASGARGDTLGARYAWQVVPLDLGLGAKVSDDLYVGGVLRVGVGAEGSDTRVERACEDDDGTIDNEIACSAASYQVGVELRYGLGSADQVNPWIGYGIAADFGHQSIHDRVRARRETTTARGVEWARLAVGLDHRMGRVGGLGPALAVGLGQYTHSRTEVNGEPVFDGPIEQTALHAWITLTVRMVLFP
ncbi:MAG: hypothetical protein KF718_05865 [Polyangiaceae bacterium]|nr:hypothetical protein [Polyangiaceae bacterium]